MLIDANSFCQGIEKTAPVRAYDCLVHYVSDRHRGYSRPSLCDSMPLLLWQPSAGGEVASVSPHANGPHCTGHRFPWLQSLSDTRPDRRFRTSSQGVNRPLKICQKKHEKNNNKKNKTGRQVGGRAAPQRPL